MDASSQNVVTQLELPGLVHVRSGKVREVFDLGELYLFVATDRVSAYDCILPNGIPGKGAILTQLSVFWFELFQDVVSHHMVSHDVADYPAVLQPYRDVLRGRSMLVRKAEMVPVECVARGYLAGSGWKEYRDRGTVVGLDLPAGYRQASRLAEPIFTPATKADSGHDINISFEAMCETVGADVATRLRDLTLSLYSTAAAYARERGILIADTKFEFGVIDGNLTLADEVLTPDSSRFWPADTYEEGGSPHSYDKQFIRDYLESLDWDKTPPAPPLPDDIVRRSSEKYLEAYRLLTGKDPAG